MTRPRILPATDDAIAEAGRLIAAGALVAFPTETVYGLAADASSERAVAAIFEAKGRPRFNPLIVHFARLELVRRAVQFDARAETVAARFWPGPLTLVLPRQADAAISLLCSAGLDSLAVRVPAHPVARRLLAMAERPVAAPSANRSGEVSPTTAAHVAQSFDKQVALVLDGGPCSIGLESTVLDLTGAQPTLLRPGAIPLETLEEMLGPVATAVSGGAAPRSPGQLESHYAPRLPLRLDATGDARPGEALLAFGPHPPSGFATVLNLSQRGDLAEAAANFFAMLRKLDQPDHAAIAVMPVPEEGLGRAINDRLRRAAAPRP
jgi:L-threonylcarbamoyladenylate synthase